jgi:hypothetical protein
MGMNLLGAVCRATGHKIITSQNFKKVQFKKEEGVPKEKMRSAVAVT